MNFYNETTTDDDEDRPRQSSEMSLDAAGTHDGALVVGDVVVIGLTKTVLLEATAAKRRDAADEAPGEPGQHDEQTEADKAGADDHRRVVGVRGVRDGDRERSDEHEPDADGNGD